MSCFTRTVRFIGFACLSLVVSPALHAAGEKSNVPAKTIRVLQFNVWQEGTSVVDGVDKIAEVILKSGADVVAFSEVRNYKGEDWHTKILAALAAKSPESGFHGRYVAGDVGLVGRIPIVSTAVVFDETKADTGSIMAYRLSCPGAREVTVCTAHLDFKHYGLNLVRGYHGGDPDWKMIDDNQDGVPDRQTDAAAILGYDRKSRRGAAIEAFLAFAKIEHAAARSVILAGDFNEGSHLDWTEAGKGVVSHYGVVLPWDNSIALTKAGFRDTWRTIFPDVVNHPGVTWPAPPFERQSTSWTRLSDERDRLDFIYASPDLRPSQAWIVGPRTSFVGDEIVTDSGEDSFLCPDLPWPSDHKGVLVELAY